jgi:hypothetical protein
MSRSEEESQEELTQVIEPVIKVNWTQHGGGTDGYYYKLPESKKIEDLKAIHEDFVDVKELLEDINKELAKPPNDDGKVRRINCLKIFRWTSPGAVLVTNEDIDDQFRAFFEHPSWHDIYENKQLNTRGGMGANLPAKAKVVGSDEGIKRGPGELLKDLHLAKYCIGDEEEDGYVPNIFTNEIISSEYKNKYTQMVAEDFGLWLLRDTGKYGSTRGVDDVKFERAFPEDWMKKKEYKKRKQALQKMHNDIFKIGKGQAGNTIGTKMSVVIKNIILECSKVVDDKEEWKKYCQNWEFYPISCSPMNGVEGKKELLRFDSGGASEKLKAAHARLGASFEALYDYDTQDKEVEGKRKALLDKVEEEHIKIEKQIEKEDGNKTVIRKRLNANSGLWFVYMLNMTRRCWVFLEGKDIRQKYIEEAIKSSSEKKLQDSVDKITPALAQFENSFDVLDPDERKQLYMDINGILQNVRPNQEKQAAQEQGENITFFRNAKILKSNGEVEEVFDLFHDVQLKDFMTRLTQGVKLDGRPNLFSKIEADWIEGEPSLLDKIIAFADERFKQLQKESGKQNEYESVNPEKIPKLIKILFYVLYSCSHKEDGIAKEYWSDPKAQDDEDLIAQLEKAMKDPDEKAPNESMGWKLGKFMPRWMTEYDFGNAVNGFFKSVWSGKYVSISKQGSGGRIGNGVLTQLDSVMGGKKPLEEGEEDYYKYLRTGFDFVHPLRSDIKNIMLNRDFHISVMKVYRDNQVNQASVSKKTLSEIFIEKTIDHLLGVLKTDKKYRYTEEMIKIEIESLINRKQILIPESNPETGLYNWPTAESPRHELVILNGDSAKMEMGFHKVKTGGKKKRKKRTRRNRKKKRKRTRKRKKRNCKKRMKKKIICLSAPNKKATRKLIRVTKKLARMKGIRLSKCSKQRIKKWGKKKKRTRRRRKR